MDGGSTPGGSGSRSVEPCSTPVRILGIGDSIAAEAVGPAIDRLAALGHATKLDARWGTGPLDADPDWLALANQHATTFRPDLVLVLFYGNYSQPRFDTQGQEILGDTDEFLRLWGERSRRITLAFTAVGAHVVWISPPPRPGLPFAPDVSETWPATVAEITAIPGVSIPTIGELLADSDGRWTSTIVGPDGLQHAVRSDDAVHLLPYGGDLMAAAIVEAATEAAGRHCTGGTDSELRAP